MSSFDERYSPLHYTQPEVVFYPDQIHHSFGLAADFDCRYRYQIVKVRSQSDFTAIIGYVYLDEVRYASFLRIEYCATSMMRGTRLHSRQLENAIHGKIVLTTEIGLDLPPSIVTLPRTTISLEYAVEVWSVVEHPEGSFHSDAVLQLIGRHAIITRVQAWSVTCLDFTSLRSISAAFEEVPTSRLHVPAVDGLCRRTHEVPNSQLPSDPGNTITDHCYHITFENTHYIRDVRQQIAPVRYRNAMMDPAVNPEVRHDNVIEMRWILQRELGGTCVFAHEVRMPPGTVEGVHPHVGSEEVYYFLSGEGFAFVGEEGTSHLGDYPIVEKEVMGWGVRRCRQLPIGSHSCLHTKSGGIHGIANPGMNDLIFFAFLHHTH